MKRRRLLLILLLLLLLCGLLLVPSVRWPVYGFLRGEAFYRGMPVSWWAQEIEQNYVAVDGPQMLHAWDSRWIVKSSPSVWDQVCHRLVPGNSTTPIRRISFNSPLSGGDSGAIPVLLELIHYESAKVRRVAIAGLANQTHDNPEIVGLLLEARKDPDELVRWEAANAMLDRELNNAGLKLK